jgi:ribosome maturation protein SDO1
MSSGFTPVNQVRLTNVAYVRLNKKGKRFEIACYRNKVVSWRNKIETNLQEVLQVQTVFINVSKGMLASSHDLVEAFGTSDQSIVCKEILDKGEMQVSEQERGALLESIFRDVASIVVEKSINPENNRPYTISMIQTAMRQIHFSASISKSSKSK